MKYFKERYAGLILLCLIAFFSHSTFAQVIGRVEIDGKIKKDNKAVPGVVIQITAEGSAPQSATSKDNGSFTFNLELQKKYSITFSKPGLVSKLIEYNTIVPPDQSDIIFQYPFNIDLFDDVAGVSQNDAMTKPVARIAYNVTYENFMDDDSYTKQIRSAQDQARKAAEEIHRMMERARLDSLNKLWNDSLAKVKARESQLASAKAEQDKMKQEQEKAKQDSITRANAAAVAAAAVIARQKTVADSLALAEEKAKALAEQKEKARQDSISKAQAEQNRLELQRAAREKTSKDSLDRVNAENARLASVAAASAAAAALAKSEADAKLREKNRVDSINQAEASLKARQKFVADSIATADANAKRAAEEARLQEKSKQDSLNKSLAIQKERQKFVDDSTAKSQADLKKRQELEDNRMKAEAAILLKARQDSSAKATTAAREREKFVADSTLAAKTAQDKKATEEKNRLEAEAKLKEKQKIEAENAALIAASARKKEIADSTQKADADAKAKSDAEQQARIKNQQDSIASAKAEALRKSKEDEENRRQIALRDKARTDSIATAEFLQKQKNDEARAQKAIEDKERADSLVAIQRAAEEKAEQDRKAKALAEIETNKQLLAKSNAEKLAVAVQPAPKAVAPIPKIRDSDYKEGVTEETVNESNRTIFRTVIKKEGATYNYQKVVYNWGGVFYFKNDNSITEITFQQDLKNAKGELK